MVFEYLIDHRPCGFHRVFASKQASVALHRVAQQPFVGRFFPRLLFQQIQLALLADKLLARALYASGESDFCVGREPEAKIVSLARGPPLRLRRAFAAVL